jgi:hypothetical protein
MKYGLLSTIIALQLLLSGCTPCAYVKDFSMDLLQINAGGEPVDESIPVIHCEEVTSVVQELAVEMKYNKGLFLEDSKVYFEDGINTIQIEFSSQNLLTLCESRELIVDVVETLLTKLNQNIILGPEFANFPFTADNLEMYITFESYLGRYIDPFYTAWIGLEDGKVYFYTFELKDNTKSCWSSRTEVYAKSREIVVYERQAEQKYRDNNRSKRDIFGGRRYFQEP